MNTMRTIALLMLALLYLGGACAQASEVVFPVVGGGEKAYGDFKGKAKEPFRPTITQRRHMPMVKPVEVSPLVPVDQLTFGQTKEFQFVRELRLSPTLQTFPIRACGNRAPPAL
jgi:hypothetical protein